MLSLDDLKRQFDKGDKNALMTATLLVVFNKLDPPHWLRIALLNACSAVQTAKVKSWDDVFGKRYKGHHREIHRRFKLSYEVWHWVRSRNAGDGMPIGAELFALAADEFGIGKRLVKELYERVQRNGGKDANIFRAHKRKPKRQ